MPYKKHLEQALYDLSNGRKNLQGNLLVERLRKKTGLERDLVIKGLESLRANNKIHCTDWLRGEPIGRVSVSIPKDVSSNEQALIMSANALSLNEKETNDLLPMANCLDKWSSSDRHALLLGLVRLRRDLPKLTGQSRYLVSSKYLLGSSKLLDALPVKALRAFGIDTNLLVGSPSYVVVAGPQNPTSVILVENPQSLEAAVIAECAGDVAWVATYGYGLSLSAEEAGDRLVRLLTCNTYITPLIRSGSPPPINELLRHSNIQFWGDLDLEGLKIFQRLKSWIPQLTLSALYHPMVQRISSASESHPYHRLTGKASQRRWSSDDFELQSLVNLCGDRAVDQECLSLEEIKTYAGNVYCCS